MTVQDQIEDAEYLLGRLRASKTREEMRVFLGCFLPMSRSIPDHLLEDYNSKFGLNIPLNKKLDHLIFKEKAKRKKNSSALRFINFYDTEFKKLTQDIVGKLVFGKRNIKIHRQDPKVRGDFGRHITEEVRIGEETLRIVVTDEDGNIKQESMTRHEEHTEPPDRVQIIYILCLAKCLDIFTINVKSTIF